MVAQYKSILIIPDPHDQPGTNQDRFEWAGEFALKRQPDYIICLGDFAEMGSLSRYDVGKVSAEGKRYCDDVASCKEALARFNKPIDMYNKKHGMFKKKKYKPTKIMLLGNHEDRIIRAASETPSLYGTLSIDDLGFQEAGWDVHGLTVPVVVEGIAFSHYFTSGVLGRPISGLNHARTLITKGLTSCVVGHSHEADWCRTISATGKPIFSLVSGCFFDYDMSWTTENKRYWRGLTYLHDVKDGYGEVEFLNLETYLKVKYGL